MECLQRNSAILARLWSQQLCNLCAIILAVVWCSNIKKAYSRINWHCAIKAADLWRENLVHGLSKCKSAIHHRTHTHTLSVGFVCKDNKWTWWNALSALSDWLDVSITAAVWASLPVRLCPWVGTGCCKNHTPQSMALSITTHSHTHHPPNGDTSNNPPPSHCLI